jgi:hypothetical protein|tara:strand:+ start:2517 stop:3551 length:1035 start_codon:yes stop_codon:yes gene_type:complete
MSEKNQEHEENLRKEFERSEGLDNVQDVYASDETQTTPEGKVSSLGKVDPTKGRGITRQDDPEIQRLQSLQGYLEFNLNNLPSGGRFYREDLTIHIRAARVGEIRDFSTMDEQNIRDVDEKLNGILQMCTQIKYGKSIGSYKDLLEEDRIYLILSIRELTFKEGEAKLLIPVTKVEGDDSMVKSRPESIELKTSNFEFQEENELTAKYYDSEGKCFSIQTKSYGTIRMAPPTIGVMRAITGYIRKKEEAGKKWDKSSLQILPYIQREWRGWGDKDIFSAITEFQGWDAGKFSLIFRLAENMKVGVKPELKTPISGSDAYASAPLEFPDGIKSLFVIPDISGELL